ncbi:MAG: GNAT family N-acetyltransferase [Gammaproteobacteria bacterium]|nr:GNAT family N-acetyltransferase [Gammaproteobacteria bacterium]MBU1625009.1 GNAT family N-acetyltransferase [Gammaproteobacteria bacterium]MBU1981269.1 GNAT family N-acetyltransferase [Gammaproteobacteria bacterium]
MGDAASLKTVRANDLHFHEVAFGSDEYKQTCELRNEVLRLPFGLNLYSEDLQQEKDQSHFGLFDHGNSLIACVIAVPQGSGQAKLRQMSVKAGYEGLGVGRRMLLSLEALLARQGVTQLSLHARISAAGFYEKLGYVRSGEPFIEIGIPHIRMEKQQQSLKKP